MNYLEIIGTLLGILYLYLEYKASAWLWIPSLLMPAIYLEVYYDAGLYADFGISIYYIIASLYGLYCWVKGPKNDSESQKISNISKKQYPGLFLIFIIIFTAIGLILSRFTDSTVPWAEAFTTALSIIAMWMLARKFLEQWIVWIVADIACSILYVYKDLWFTGGLYLAYAIVAFFGYRKWKYLMK